MIRRYNLGGGRGLYRYGIPLKCSYGSTLTVQDSSAASKPHAWLSLQAWPEARYDGSLSAHLNVRQAEALIARLQAFIDFAQNGRG